MLRFFRHIRKKLIEQDNVRKYLLYTIGEIALVMIGILLALQVNNWNEQRKMQNLSDEFTVRIMEDLDRLVQRSEDQSKKNQDILESVTKTQRLLVRGTPLNDSEKEIVDFAILWFPRTTYQLPNMLTYEEMKESGQLNLIDDISLRNELAEFYSFLLQVESVYDQLGNNIESQFDVYNRHIKANTNPENLEIEYSYDFEAMTIDEEFINTFSRMTVHWRGLVFFMEAVHRDGISLKEKMSS